MFNKAAYKARFINISTVCPDKQEESELLRLKVAAWQAIEGNDIYYAQPHEMNGVHKTYKEKSSEELKNG